MGNNPFFLNMISSLINSDTLVLILLKFVWKLLCIQFK